MCIFHIPFEEVGKGNHASLGPLRFNWAVATRYLPDLESVAFMTPSPTHIVCVTLRVLSSNMSLILVSFHISLT